MKAQTEARPRYRSIPGVAEELDVDRTTVWRWVRDGHLPAIRLGPRTIRVDAADVAVLIRNAAEEEGK